MKSAGMICQVPYDKGVTLRPPAAPAGNGTEKLTEKCTLASVSSDRTIHSANRIGIDQRCRKTNQAIAAIIASNARTPSAGNASLKSVIEGRLAENSAATIQTCRKYNGGSAG